MNRPRKETESYEEYRENLKNEAFLLKEYLLKGRIFWQSRVRGQYISKFRQQRKQAKQAKKVKG